MSSVFVVYEFFEVPFSDKIFKNVDRVFLSKAKAVEYCESEQKRARKERLDGYSWEYQEAPFDSSL